MGNQIELLQGTLDLMILKTLALEPMHGWGIAQRIQQVSKEVLQVGQGSLYRAGPPEQRRWISSDGAAENRARQILFIDQIGPRQLEKEMGEWDRLSAAIALVLAQG